MCIDNDIQHASGMKTVKVIWYVPCQGSCDQTIGRSHWETDDENRDRLGHPRSPKVYALGVDIMVAQCTVGPM